MKFLSKSSDGGKNSGVTGYFLVEIKPLFSIVLLRFSKSTRDAFHEHAFNAFTIWLRGLVREHHLDGTVKDFKAGQWKLTPREIFHKIEALETSWAISFRGPWKDTWREFRKDRFVTLTHGRKEVA